MVKRTAEVEDDVSIEVTILNTALPPAARTHGTQIAFGNDPSPSVETELHLRNLLVHLLHELDDEIYQLVLEHCL